MKYVVRTLRTRLAAIASPPEDDVGSLVDMAKSYMRAWPPWHLPILSSIGTTVSSATHLFEDKTPLAIRNHSFFTSKDLRRSHHEIGFDETRRVHLKSVANIHDPTISQQVDSSIRVSELQASEAISAASQRDLPVACIDYDSSSLPSTKASRLEETSMNIPAEVAVEDSHPQVIIGLPDGRTAKVILEAVRQQH